MDKIHLENIIKSFFLGLFIGILLQFFNDTNVLFEYKIVTVLASGSIGFIIGFITEWLTAILPISIANSKIYFFINNLIALIITTLIMLSLVIIADGQMDKQGEFIPILSIVLSIICIANLFDYMMYRRVQQKLKTFKAMMKDK
ncbi:MAG: hypothetical protein NAG76_06295 [Candidatus Pristimantibacillus lignocellulolyticus]|uniref:Uncharacterized protein n=1 Tax=Candidatus Pristimantibacillus lignocellulolyticus TaxID=2994561 RepID=A0A9J6ZIH7_9BACL|nr:MAG: hypothetical protein NAG76_06295 [Candidatus Pristimantibacillus lignocellulolyticus]